MMSTSGEATSSKPSRSHPNTPTSRLARSAITSRQLFEDGAEDSNDRRSGTDSMSAAFLGSPMATATTATDDFAGELPPPPSSPAISYADMMEQIDESNFTFRKSHVGGVLTLRQQEKIMDEIKKENFDLKLRVDSLQDRLNRAAPGNIEMTVNENVELRVANETLKAEVRTYKQMAEEANMAAEEARSRARSSGSPGINHEDVQRLKSELEHTKSQLSKSQTMVQRLEGQLNLYDDESRTTAQRMKQLELDAAGAQKRYAEAQGTVSALREEIKHLEEELTRKMDTIRRFTHDIHSSSADVDMVAKQVQSLQHSLKTLEEERDALLRDRDLMRRNLEKAEAQVKLANLSPRKSLDLLESKLLKELGQTTRKITDLERQTNLSQSEKDTLQVHSRKMGMENALAISTLQKLVTRVKESAELVSVEGGASENPSLTQVIEETEVICKAILEELDDNRMQRRLAETQLVKLKRDNTLLHRDNESTKEQLEAAQVQLEKLQLESSTKGSEVRSLQESVRSLQAKIKAANEDELPRLQEEVTHLQDKVRQLQASNDAMRDELARVYDEKDGLAQRCEQLQSKVTQYSVESNERKSTISNLHQAREELLSKLAVAEETMLSMQTRLDEAEKATRHTGKLTSALEERFNADLKALHQTNTELRMQLSSQNSGKSDLSHRMERLQLNLSECEKRNDELYDRLQAKEQTLSTMKRDYDGLVMERSTLEAELKERQEQLHKLESDILRLRREDFVSRKTTDGVDLLQGKLDQLTKINTILSERLAEKERNIRQLEDRLGTQEEEMKSAMGEVEAQRAKLKKREGLISQALKRLEQINYMRTTGTSPLPDTAPTTATTARGLATTTMDPDTPAAAARARREMADDGSTF